MRGARWLVGDGVESLIGGSIVLFSTVLCESMCTAALEGQFTFLLLLPLAKLRHPRQPVFPIRKIKRSIKHLRNHYLCLHYV